MEREAGDKQFPIWLLGDSEPKNWQRILQTPLDPRHPARHNIWTLVLEVIQDYVFRKLRNRVDTSLIYIRNAVGDHSIKPPLNVIDWDQRVGAEITRFTELIKKYSPRIVLCFGAFSFELARRALDQTPQRKYGYWGAERLGDEFRKRIGRLDCKATNVIPMLHVSIARGKFIRAHELFCEAEGTNYFNFVGTNIAQKIIEHRDELDIWIAKGAHHGLGRVLADNGG